MQMVRRGLSESLVEEILRSPEQRLPGGPDRAILQTMKVLYDSKTDTVSVILKVDARVVESDEVRPGVILDYDQEGQVVSVEVLEASHRVTDADKVEFEAVG